jgi:hypothetical protein
VATQLDEFYSLIPALKIGGQELVRIISEQSRKKKKREIASAVFACGVPGNLAPVAEDLCELMFEDEGFAGGFGGDALAEIILAVRGRSAKAKALARLMGYLTDGGIWRVIRSAGPPYEDIAVPGKRPLLPGGKGDIELAKALEERGLISSSRIDSGGLRIETFRS